MPAVDLYLLRDILCGGENKGNIPTVISETSACSAAKKSHGRWALLIPAENEDGNESGFTPSALLLEPR